MIELYQAVLQAVQGGQTAAPAPGITAPVPGIVAPPTPALAPPSSVTPAAVTQAVAIAPVEIAPTQDWNQVQTLLTRCQALPKQEQRQHSALFRVMGKLKAAAGSEQARNRLFPQLTGKPAPVVITPVDDTGAVLAEPEIASSSKPSEPQRVSRLQGRPISAIFQKAQDQPPAAKQPGAKQADVPPEPPRKPGKRLVSKLFEQPEQK
jgi:hypothetical protein